MKEEKKIALLWVDKRKFTEKLLISFMTTFAMCFTFLFFGPFEIAATNATSMACTPKELLPIMALGTIGICIVVTLFLAMLRGKIFNYSATLVFSLTVCGYIQGNFLNDKVSSLDGNAIAWNEEIPQMMINLILWVFISLIFYLILYLDVKIWGKMLKFISFMLITMQAVAFISLSLNGAFSVVKNKEAILTTSELFTYSKDTNTLVFVLDRLDYKYIEYILEEDQNFFDKLDGFTNYTNATGEHTKTAPGLNYLLTNDPNAFTVSFGDYLYQSWNQKNINIVEDLSNDGYHINMYSDISYLFGNYLPYEEVSNLINTETEEISIDCAKMYKSLLKLSAYRYGPTISKPFFWSYSGAINNDVVLAEGMTEFWSKDIIYEHNLEDVQLVEDKVFKFYHFEGSHAPYNLTEDGRMSSSPTDVVQQTKGSFNILFRAFEKMKELGIYENMEIIITADHGENPPEAMLSEPVRIALFYKPKGSSQTPLEYSTAPVSQKNIPATILKSANLPYDHYGQPLDEVAEEDAIIRYFYKPVYYYASSDLSDWNENKKDMLYTYEIIGDSADFNNWKLIKEEEMPYRY